MPAWDRDLPSIFRALHTVAGVSAGFRTVYMGLAIVGLALALVGGEGVTGIGAAILILTVAAALVHWALSVRGG